MLIEINEFILKVLEEYKILPWQFIELKRSLSKDDKEILKAISINSKAQAKLYLREAYKRVKDKDNKDLKDFKKI